MSLLLFLRSFLGLASSVLDPIAQALADAITAISGLSPSVKGMKWDPGMSSIDIVPAGIVGMPKIERATAGAGESQLGAFDWRLDYPVALVFDLSEASYSQARAVESVEAFIKKIDADPTLGGIVFDSKVSEAEPTAVEDEKRPTLVYRCRVEVRKLV